MLAGVLIAPGPASSLPAPKSSEATTAVGGNIGGTVGRGLPALSASTQQAGLLRPLRTLLCPPVTTLAETLKDVPVSGDLAATLRQLVCSIDQLEYRFFTVWKGPGGNRIQREHLAIVGVPTPLDVDSNPGPDLTGTIGVGLAFDRLTMTVERTPGQSGPLPASVEAIISDPSGGLGKDSIAFGYDQLDDRAPRLFKTEVLVPGALGPGDPAFDLRVSQQAPGPSTTLVGATFDGSPQARENPTAARIRYRRSPLATNLLLTLDDPLQARITTDVTGPLVASLIDADGDRELRAKAEIVDLPRVFEVEVGFEDPRVRYTGQDESGAAQGIDELELEVESTDALFARAQNLRAKIKGLTSGTELSVDAGGERASLTTTEAIESVEFFAGSDREQPGDLPPAGEQGARYFDRSAAPYVIAARIFELERLEAELGESVGLHARTAGGLFTLLARLDSLEADAAIRDLPRQLDLGFDFGSGAVSYAGSDRIDEIDFDLRSAQPLFAAASELSLLLRDIPEAFELGIGPDGDGLEFSADNPIGLIEATANSPGASDESNLLGPDDSGAVLRDLSGEFFLFARLFEMRELAVALDPIALSSKMQGGRVFTVDAKVEQTEDGALEDLADALTAQQAVAAAGDVVHISALVDKLPPEISLGLGDADADGGTRLSMAGSDPIDLLRITAEGLELLEGADDVKVEINEVPTELTVALPEEGALATIEANDNIGQLRLSASDGSGELPTRTLLPGDPQLNDLFRFGSLPGDFNIALRLTAVGLLSMDLDPVNISLEQDQTRTRAIDLDAAFDSEGGQVKVEGLLNKPGARTSMSVELEPGQPTRLIFDNSQNMQRFELRATGLGSLESVQAAFDNLSRRMSICMDPGPACQRPNPNSVQRYATAQTTGASLDFDDFGTHGSGTGPAFRTTLNANLAFESGDPVSITNLRFRNLGFDFQDANNPHSSNCGTVPRMSLFFDSRGHPFVVNSIKYPPAIVDFRIGTDGSPARARNRIARLNGWNTGFGGCLGGLNTQSAGAMDCGGQRVLVVKTALGNVNILNFLGLQLLPVCGGTVSSPQPW